MERSEGKFRCSQSTVLVFTPRRCACITVYNEMGLVAMDTAHVDRDKEIRKSRDVG